MSLSLAGKTVFVTGGSRGIGLAIAKRAARDGANVVLAAKTIEPHPKLPGTIFTAAKECESLGGKALALQLNVQDDNAVQEALRKAADHFGGKIDILINNASAIDNSDTASLATKKYDLMHSINSRGTFMMSKFAIPYLLKSENPQVLNLSPPVDSLIPPSRPATPEWYVCV
jgi:citronellol/citronellal dehydrogenase